MIRASVIVPMRNASAWIEECLDALQRQEFPGGDYEIIVVDNCSSDDSASRVQQRPQITLLDEPVPGSYAARNRGIRAASGDVIAFIDADCVAQPGWLANLKKALAANGESRVVMGRDIPTGPSEAIRLLGLYDHYKERFALGNEDPSVYYGHTNCMIVRRKVFEDLGLFDERPRGADVIFIQHVISRYGTDAVIYKPEAVVNHLEVKSAPLYFRKAFIYGRSARSYRKVVQARPLHGRERFQVYGEVVRGQSLSIWESIYLLLLLSIGVSCWFIGSLIPWQESPAQGEESQSTLEVEG